MRKILQEMTVKILEAHPVEGGKNKDFFGRLIRRDKAEQTLRLLGINNETERDAFIKAVKGD